MESRVSPRIWFGGAEKDVRCRLRLNEILEWMETKERTEKKILITEN
jgi:hypothetical protein